MSPFIAGGNVPIEGRIEQLARLALVILLIVTLGSLGKARAQDGSREAARESTAALILIAKPGLRDEFFGASILIAKPIGDGRHVGFAINRPSDMTLGRLFLFIAVDAKTVDRIIAGDASHARFFAGLIAWRPGELQEELKRGLWYVQESDSDLVMRKPTEGLWEELVKRSERRANSSCSAPRPHGCRASTMLQ